MAVRHPEYVLAGAVAVCLPMAPGLLNGQISATTAGERFLIALVVCWVLGSVLGWVIGTYGDQARRAEVVRMIDESRRPDESRAHADVDPARESDS